MRALSHKTELGCLFNKLFKMDSSNSYTGAKNDAL